MTHKAVKLRSKIFLYIASFAGIILFILFLFQIVFLNDFYKFVKTNQVKDAANAIVTEIDNNDLNAYLDGLSKESDYCVRVLEITNNVATEAYYNANNRSVCGMSFTTTAEVVSLYTDALANNGEVIRNDGQKEIHLVALEPSSVSESVKLQPKPSESITLGKIVESNAKKYFILLDARTTPINETVATLMEQFKIISVVLVLLTVILAYMISIRISKPILKINEDAKKLSTGDFSVHFEGSGYVEIEELNQTLNYAVQQLSKVESLRNELIANMSHDLRTPLTMIGGYAEVIRDLPDENTVENIQVIIDETHRLTQLVNNILELSKLQSKSEELNVSTFNLTNSIRDIAKRFETMLEKDHFVFELSLDQDVYVEADEMKIHQVLYNIIGNATHFTGADCKVMIRQERIGHKVRVSIEDTGKGIKQEELAYVWDRYYHKQSNFNRQKAGSGIGLSIVKGILDLHQEAYGVTSELGKGATFYFELPIIEEEHS